MKTITILLISIFLSTFTIAKNSDLNTAQLHTIEYGKNLKKSQKQIGSTSFFKLTDSKINKDGTNTAIFALSEQIAMTTTSDKQGINNLTFAGGSNGTTRGSIEFIFAATSAIMALENPYMKQAQRAKILRQLGLSGNAPVISKRKVFDFNTKHYHITSNYMDRVGLLITADRL